MPVKFSQEESSPGFYQGLRGRASGRPSPRVPLRAPRREQVYADHGLIESGQADPNQGQLFNPDQTLGPATPQATMSRNAGVAPPLVSNQGGFMPGIQRKTRAGTVKAKVNALNKIQDARARTGADRGTGAPIREAMQDRQSLYDSGRPADWYMPVDGGKNVMGESKARTAIDNAARRTGTTSERMTRSVALTSPRTAWDDGGTPGTTDYRMPNIEGAEKVTRAVQGVGVDAHPDVVRAAGENVTAQTLPQAQGKAAGMMQDPTNVPIPIADPSSQKVPNFEQSLNLSHVDPAVVRGAAGSYTVDGWDVKGIGGDEKMLKSDTGYAAAHMTGTRAALKNREIPGNFQARTWNSLREQPGRYGASPDSMGTNRLFVSDRSKPQLQANPSATWGDTPAASTGGSRTSKRGGRTPDDLTPF